MLTLRTIRRILRRRAAERVARQAIHEHGVHAACRALIRLNLHAKESPTWRLTIYEAKTALIKHLYATFPGNVTREQQQRDCWGYVDRTTQKYAGCKGSSCRKCGGSGSIPIESLVVFHFLIDGHTYAWHMPAHSIDWEVVIDRREPSYRFVPRNPEVYEPCTDRDAEVLYATIQLYLAAEGVQLQRSRKIGLRDAVMADVAKVRLRLRRA